MGVGGGTNSSPSDLKTQFSEHADETVMWDRIKRPAVAHVDYIYCFSPISVACHSVIGGN